MLEERMRRTFLQACVLAAGALLNAGVASAQHAELYASTGVAKYRGAQVQAAAGIELLMRGRAGVSLELGRVGWGDRDHQLTHGSVSGSYHFARAGRRRLDPFVSGGIGLVADWDAVATAYNVGAGVTFWPRLRVGLRVEARDDFALTNGILHVPGVRVGISLR
jgi:hypothetical protein